LGAHALPWGRGEKPNTCCSLGCFQKKRHSPCTWRSACSFCRKAGAKLVPCTLNVQGLTRQCTTCALDRRPPGRLPSIVGLCIFHALSSTAALSLSLLLRRRHPITPRVSTMLLHARHAITCTSRRTCCLGPRSSQPSQHDAPSAMPLARGSGGLGVRVSSLGAAPSGRWNLQSDICTGDLSAAERGWGGLGVRASSLGAAPGRVCHRTFVLGTQAQRRERGFGPRRGHKVA